MGNSNVSLQLVCTKIALKPTTSKRFAEWGGELQNPCRRNVFSFGQIRTVEMFLVGVRVRPQGAFGVTEYLVRRNVLTAIQLQ